MMIFTEIRCHLSFAERSMVKRIITSSRRGYTEPTLARISGGDAFPCELTPDESLFYCSLFTVLRAKTPNLLIDLASASHLL